ncbi:MAG: septum formation protein Maf [Ruminococcus sp.]|nr:septum formation protein Maf [Ruminococcus sp.]HPY83498.1 Maf family protein [Ruminococcus flavefaciens]
MDIILASASPRRRELMKLITESFTAVSTDADETLPEGIQPDKASEYLSCVKAEAAAASYPDALVIGCDTVVIVDDFILGKPVGEVQCREFLSLLSGRSHRVITGCTLIYKGNKHTFSCSTDVNFLELSDDDIERYIATGEPFDKAGGYGIQGKGALLIESIFGDYFNVVGLPVSMLNRELNSFINSVKE